MKETLKSLGFTPHKTIPKFYYHNLLEGVFDFSAVSLEGVIVKVFANGVLSGTNKTRGDIKDKFSSFINALG